MNRCPFCLSTDVEETLIAREMVKGTREQFRFAICANCRSAYNVDFPKNIGDYYKGYYSFEEEELTLDQHWWKRGAVSLYARTIVGPGFSHFFRKHFRSPSPRQMTVLAPNLQALLYLSPRSNARILDVGSGRGLFVKMMRRFGYRNAIGIDPFLDPSAESEFSHRRDLQDVSEKFDVILFNHSLEHTTEPEASIRKAAELLTTRGTIVVHVPNMQAKTLEEFKENWCWLHAPYHYAIPSRRGLDTLAGRASLRVMDAICTSRYDHYLYHDEYKRGIADCDPVSVHRELEKRRFDRSRWLQLARQAEGLNRTLVGDWIAYYLVQQ